MKKWFKISLIISIILNLFFIYVTVRNYQSEPYTFDFYQPEFKFYTVNINSEKSKFLEKLRTNYPVLAEKKYIFINFWSGNSDGCMDQLPMLDTLIEPLRNDIAYLLVNQENKHYVNRRLNGRKVKTKNFFYMNESDSFMHAICKETKMTENKRWGLLQILPMNIILDQKGNIVYFDTLRPLTGFKMDSTADKKYVRQIKQTLSNLK